MDLGRGDPAAPDVLALMQEHLADMYATSPAESVHALDPAALLDPAVTFWTVREDGLLLGCGALRELDSQQGEIKSMRTATAVRGRGVAGTLLRGIIGEATARGYLRLLLETGTEDFFAPARRLYARHGFTDCPPFGSYTEDPHSTFMRLDLQRQPAAP
ncbi:GNAT family N-acetyltransferase [Arthrobacter sp. zg-Y40]|uniref:GNAT family N-acetyltransferase n=1 Tax=Arthrobacter sp. zg-Y40 TaxID=2886939 RepID=UPI001D15E004|nr:GNAT family N-acetyltransferase [Arthrobacter sp. zg-Y40]MCC3278399.1 GNAT family N-acetyltransferase [Arthrobacter sp. zg-Y40]